MVVDFRLKRVPRFRVASITRVGAWKQENLRAEFEELKRWARQQGVRTGHWIFFERGADRWEACLEFRGKARPTGRVRLKALDATHAAAVLFDPDQVSSSVVYHGLRDWTHEQKRMGSIKRVTGVREIYPGDPWRDPGAWAHCEVQFLVQR